MKKNQTLFLTQAAMIATIYVVLTGIAAGFDLANGAIQVRFSEALTVLPFFTPAAVPGLTIGCLLSNILFSGNIFDIIFGTLATLLGALVGVALVLARDAGPDERASHHGECRQARGDGAQRVAAIQRLRDGSARREDR